MWVFDGFVEDARTARRPSSRAVREQPRPAASAPVDRGADPGASGRRSTLPGEITDELTDAVGRRRATVLSERLASAARAYERDRYEEALRTTRSLVREVPESPAARELHGLACYRIGRWREAIKHLEAARALQGDDPSQIPVLMDCHRAQGHDRKVEKLWQELREASPDADVLAEGRLVLAATLADRAELAEAIEVLVEAGAGRSMRSPAERHVRQWYVLADLYERAGDLPRARELFTRVLDADPELADARIRLASLGRPGRQARPRTREPAAPRKPGTRR
ncbi:MAG: tetratricopeptide repeat protein [Acidimicrobiales bacterium]